MCVCVCVYVFVCVVEEGERENVSTLQTCCTHQIYVRVSMCVVCLCVSVCVYVTGLMSCKPQRRINAYKIMCWHAAGYI